MPPSAPWNLFALVNDREQPVLRVPLSQELQREVQSLFESQAAELTGDHVEEIAFEPTYTPDESEVFFVDGFELPGAVSNALAHPIELEDLRETDDALSRVTGFFSGDSRSRRVLFQAFDRRRLLRPSGFTLVLMDRTFRRLESSGVTLDSRLVAAYRDGRLYFRSLHQARRLFDLAAHFAEGTDEELRGFVGHAKLDVEDRDSFVREADAWTRKHVALIMKSGIMEAKTPQEIVGVAARYRVEIKFDSRGRLVLPSERRAMKNLLRVLNDSFFTSDLSGRQYLANSKRPLR